ncbi:MAG: hypothetical protein O8C61_03610 [Candidatus Methanoperedens sp.]|nr:hypothetical protein [Candidatus Methanoperedens sp.]
MPNDNKTQEFLQKLAPCIERGDLDACVEEAARVAREMGVGAEELLIFFNADVGTKNIKKNNFSDMHHKKAIEGYKKKESNKNYMEIIQIVHKHMAG